MKSAVMIKVAQPQVSALNRGNRVALAGVVVRDEICVADGFVRERFRAATHVQDPVAVSCCARNSLGQERRADLGIEGRRL